MRGGSLTSLCPQRGRFLSPLYSSSVMPLAQDVPSRPMFMGLLHLDWAKEAELCGHKRHDLKGS